jgi:hypothetical protein
MPSMTITIPAEKYDDFKKYFLLAHPQQHGDVGRCMD